MSCRRTGSPRFSLTTPLRTPAAPRLPAVPLRSPIHGSTRRCAKRLTRSTSHRSSPSGGGPAMRSRANSSSCWREQVLAHHDEVAGELAAFRIGELAGPVFHVTEFPVERRQFGAQVDDFDFHGSAPVPHAPSFSRVHEHRAEALALLLRIDREHSEIAVFVANLDVHAPDQHALVLEQEEIAVLETPPDVSRIGPIAVDEECLDLMGERDERRYAGCVRWACEADVHECVIK